MSLLFLKLLLAHLIGDFVLQPSNWVDKRKEHVRYLFFHVAVHIVLLGLLFLPELSEKWPIVVLVSATHLLIDSLKIYMERKWPLKPFQVFVVDQTLHVLSLLLAVVFVYGMPEAWVEQLYAAKTICYVLAILLICFVSPIALRVFFSRWDTESDFKTKPQGSLADAGLLIGIMERLLIVLFIQLGFLSGIGFLLGAKSIFRFGDLTNAKDAKFTEYILVGTFASFVLGIVIGYALKFGLKYLA
ncbi:DUF3307 domain-containing protein [Sphingobacterium bambusae]|uniref:DUF3307 domain-containing protein n=1 Tax=Sphingobacterium bambusae TaxID=662858 RepID=A0ABW6BE72_9SPHI|nr:DUF3307 domain-containing protein [Sphingobacterium bambusae]WPL48433.1 DUF3307 domain-containing protein [Sphingobacterium bambusae]